MGKPINLYVQAKLSLPGVHHWPEAPESLTHLRHPHRHVFVIRPLKRVSHVDRETEFHQLGAQLQDAIDQKFPRRWQLSNTYDFGTWSCEQIATWLVETFDLESCSVHEDDENGAIAIVDGSELATRQIAAEVLRLQEVQAIRDRIHGELEARGDAEPGHHR